MNEYHEHDEPEVEIETESESVRNDYREAAILARDFYRRWVTAIVMFKGDARFAIECGCLALGWGEIIGVNSQVELAEKWGVMGKSKKGRPLSKQNVAKLISHIQKFAGAPPIPSQRSTEGKNKMSEKRKGQLK